MHLADAIIKSDILLCTDTEYSARLW